MLAITDTRCYVSIMILSTLDNTKLLQELWPGFRRTTDSNKNQLK